MLAAGREHLFYYDGNPQEVRRLSQDLKREDVVTRKLICSPIAASDRIYCGHVEGLFQISLPERTPRPLTPNQRNLITSLAASSAGVAWVSEVGAEELAVRRLPIH